MTIRVENLDFKFCDETPLYQNSFFEIPNGKMTVLLGLNGMGKSTLFKILTGAIKTNAHIYNDFKNIFYLPQVPFCPKGLSAFDYLSTVFYKNGLKWFLSDEERAKTESALYQAGLSDKKFIDVDKLSGGEFQKLNLALALIAGADLLLLDEPVSSLDIINQTQVLDTIKKFSMTSVVILHDLNPACDWGDNFVAIDKNHRIIQYNKEEFFTPEVLKTVYGADFNVVKNDKKYYIQIIN